MEHSPPDTDTLDMLPLPRRLRGSPVAEARARRLNELQREAQEFLDPVCPLPPIQLRRPYDGQRSDEELLLEDELLARRAVMEIRGHILHEHSVRSPSKRTMLLLLGSACWLIAVGVCFLWSGAGL